MTKWIIRGRETEVDDETGDYIDEDGTLCNVQADDAEDQRNEKRKRLGLTYWGMENECSPEEQKARHEATEELGVDARNAGSTFSSPFAADQLRQAANALLAEFVRVITRSQLVVWSRTDDDDETAGFSAALDTGASDLEIMVRRSEVGFRAAVSWFGKDDAVVAEMKAAIDAELYAEVEESYRASESCARVNAKVAIIRRGTAMAMRPYLKQG